MRNDLRIDVRLKNGAMSRFREHRGITQRGAAELANIPCGTWCAMENLRPAGYRGRNDQRNDDIVVTTKGEWSMPAKKVAALLGMEPEDIWPESLLKVAGNRVVVDMDSEHAERLSLCGGAPGHLQLPDPERYLDMCSMEESIPAAMGVLTPNEKRVIVLRFGLDGDGKRTLEEIAQIMERNRERIRQIESKALRKLRHDNNIMQQWKHLAS